MVVHHPASHLSTTFEQLYLRMDRPDLALKQVKTMRATDEDHTLTMLATAWTNLSSGAAKGAQVSTRA